MDGRGTIQLMRYRMYYQNGEQVSCEQLPPLIQKGSPIKYVRIIFRKTNISNPLIRTHTCAYQGIRNVSFSENFAYILNPEDHGWMLDNDNDKLDIRWVGCNAAPDEIILQVLFSPQNSF